MNDKGVCRAALALPGYSNKIKATLQLNHLANNTGVFVVCRADINAPVLALSGQE